VAIAEREISWISRFASPKKAPGLIGKASAAQSSPRAHIDLLRRFIKVAPHLVPKDKSLWTSYLWHRDLRAANLFVNEGRITSVIDWQTAWTGPLFLQAQHPRLIHHNGEVMLRLPENFKDLDEDEQTQVQEQVGSSILLYIYETTTTSENPPLAQVYCLPLGRLRRDVVTFCENTWEDDILPFRQCLIRIERSVFHQHENENIRNVLC